MLGWPKCVGKGGSSTWELYFGIAPKLWAIVVGILVQGGVGFKC